MSNISKNFSIDEFVPSSVYNRFGYKSQWFIRPEIVSLAEYFRKEFGVPIIINDWSWGGQYQYSGFRPKSSNVGAEYSQHRLGNAIDMKFEGITVQEVYAHVMETKARQTRFALAGLRCMEDIKDTTATNKYGGWLHVDCRYTGTDKEILIVKP